MNKENKDINVEDLAVEKVSDDHLKELQGKVATINQAQLQLGGLESQKHNLLHGISSLQKELSDFQNKLEEEYGKVSINITDGTIAPLPEQPTNEAETKN